MNNDRAAFDGATSSPAPRANNAEFYNYISAKAGLVTAVVAAAAVAAVVVLCLLWCRAAGATRNTQNQHECTYTRCVFVASVLRPQRV